MNDILNKTEYAFLKENTHLGNNICLIAYGGSIAYGTNNENSDTDIRGISTRTKKDILIRNDFEQVVDTRTDTTIYSFDKIIKLLCACNPNVIEILGCKPEHYIYLNEIGKLLLENKSLFLSKRAIQSFGGYANAQLRRLESRASRDIGQSQMEKYILKSIEHADATFKQKYFYFPEDSIKLYIDEAVNDDYETEIFCDINLHHYPIRDYKGMLGEMGTIIKSYSVMGDRNKKAITHDKLGKHMMHLIRLYLMAFDILEKGEINTYREKEHDFLMDIRNGKYLGEDKMPTKEFYEIVNEYENKLNKLKDTTDLPKDVDKDKIDKFVAETNEHIILNGD